MVENVVAAKLAANAVTEAKIANGAVTTNKIAKSSISSAEVRDYSLTKVDFAKGQLPKGPPGPQGPPGTVGKLKLQTASVSIAKSNSSEARVSCPTGEQAVSGGATWSKTGDLNETLVYSGPIYNSSSGMATGWLARGRNQTGSSQTFVIQVLCGAVG